MELAARRQAKTVAVRGASTPDTTGRFRVRAMTASTRPSTAWLKAAPAAAPRPMPTEPARRRSTGTIPGTARNIPTTAVKTMVATIFGLHTSTQAVKKWRTDGEPAPAAAAPARGTVMVGGLNGDAS